MTIGTISNCLIGTWKNSIHQAELNEDLFGAIGQGDLAEAEEILADGASINAKNNKGNTSLHEAATNGDAAMVGMLIAGKAKVNSRNKLGNTPLMLASSGGHIEVVELLLNAGANLGAQNHVGLTALSKAVSKGHNAIAKALIIEEVHVSPTERADVQPIINEVTEIRNKEWYVEHMNVYPQRIRVPMEALFVAWGRNGSPLSTLPKELLMYEIAPWIAVAETQEEPTFRQNCVIS